MNYNQKKKQNFKRVLSLTSKGFLIDTVLKDGKTKFLVFDRDKETFELKSEFEYLGETYKTIGGNNPFVSSNTLLLPTWPNDYGRKGELVSDIVNYFYKYVDVPLEFCYISAYYVLLTYIYSDFSEIPYLRVLGDYGSGKSRFLKTVGGICYNSTMLGGGATLSSIFRIINGFKGAVVIDEADFSNSNTTSGIIKLLNTGYQKSTPIIRADPDSEDGVRFYNVYCPKIIGGRNEFSDRATESRCLTHLMKRSERDDIPVSLGEEFLADGLEIRNKLLKFRFDSLGKEKPGVLVDVSGIEPRLKQILSPLLSIIDSKDIQENVFEFMINKQNEIIDDRRNSLYGGILLKIHESLFIGIKEKLSFIELCDEVYKNDNITLKPQALGYFLKENGIKSKRLSGGKVIYKEGNEDTLKRLFKEYGIFDSDSKNNEVKLE